MTRFLRVFSGVILLALFFTIGIVCAAEADLNVSKVVSSTGPYEPGDNVTWVVTLWNIGLKDATNITLAEDVSKLDGLQDITAVANKGEYNSTTNIWYIDELKNATSTSLTLITSFSTPGEKINSVTITALDQTDPVLTDNHAEATVQIKAPEIIPPGPGADLNVSKMVSSTGPYEIDDEVTWIVTLWNNGPGNATNITLAEDMSHLYGLKNVTAAADIGIYNATTNLWQIDTLENSTHATLTVKTTFNTPGTKLNRIDITALDEKDPVLTDNHAEATVRFNMSRIIDPDTPVSANLVIRPTVLNLKSKGVFTVYVSLDSAIHGFRSEGRIKPRIDYANSSLTCSDADLVRASISNKGGGTLIAKFHRDDLENVTAGDGVHVNCSGILAVNGKTISVEGSDTIRVIGEKSETEKILSRLWKFLGLEKDDVEINETDDGNITIRISLNPDSFKNNGQIKKVTIDTDNESAPNTDNVLKVSDKTLGPKENAAKNTSNNKNLRENNTNDTTDKGNKNANERNGESPRKSNGKKNK